MRKRKFINEVRRKNSFFEGVEFMNINNNSYIKVMLTCMGGVLLFIIITCGLDETLSLNAICLVIEFCFIFILISLSNWLIKGFLLPAIIINTLQFASFFSTSNYLIPLTLTNLNSYSSIGLKSLFTISIVSTIWFLLFIPAFFLKKKLSSVFTISLSCLFVVAEIFVSHLPIHDFFKTIALVSKELTFHSINSEQVTVDLNKRFRKEFRVSTNIPFTLEGKNVILIFIEGFSREVISPELTPNIDNLSKIGISFSNYFSHTAATFRGIRGQLISGYQLGQGYTETNNGIGQLPLDEVQKSYCSKPVESLPGILNGLGYSTIFISPHPRTEALLPFLSCLKFQYTYGSEDFTNNSNATDKEMFKEIFDVAKTFEKKNQPFFLASYVWGTHHGMDSPDKKYKEGNNSYLNKFHNVDFWLGEFIQRFKNSSLFDNTALIITADHSTFPTNEFNKTFGLNKKYFLGEIPLIIYGKNLPSCSFESSYANSLSLAPTILDLINPKETIQTHFLGSSLFSNEKNIYSSYGALGFHIFHNINGSYTLIDSKDNNPKHNKVRNSILDFYKLGG